MISLFKEQPTAFYLIFMLEFWERFGFYTVNAILAYFFVKSMGLDSNQAFYTFGAYSALVYGLASFGGYVGDKVLGAKRSIVLGLIILALGYGLLSTVNNTGVYHALGIIAVGTGLFKANPSSLLSKCYQPKDSRLHGAFTLYYMAINIGSVFAMLIAPWMMEHFSWHAAFFFSFFGLVLALANYYFQRNSIRMVNVGPDQYAISYNTWLVTGLSIVCLCALSSFLLRHVHVTETLLGVVTLVVVIVYLFYLKQEVVLNRKKMWVALILMIEAIAFFTLYQQMPTSINFYAIHHVRPTLLGFYLNPQSFQVFNPVWIMILSPLLAQWYRYQHVHGNSRSAAYKFALGMTLCGISFLVLYISGWFADASFKVNSYWLVLSYLFQSAGELLVSALGVAMVAELVPQAIVGFIMGMWFLSPAIGGFSGAFVASLTQPAKDVVIGAQSLHVYCHVFLEIGVVSLLLAILMWLSSPALGRIIRQ